MLLRDFVKKIDEALEKGHIGGNKMHVKEVIFVRVY